MPSELPDTIASVAATAECPDAEGSAAAASPGTAAAASPTADEAGVAGPHVVSLVASDLDGTLLNAQHTVSDVNREAVSKLQQRGIPVMVCTGRSTECALPIIESLGLNTHAVTFNGACVLSPKDASGRRQVLHQSFLPSEVLRGALGMASEAGHVVNVYLNDRIYARSLTETHRQLVERYRTLTGAHYEFVDSYERFEVEDVPKLIVLLPGHAVEAFYAQIVAAFPPSVATVFRGEFFVELLHPESNKGAALRWLCAHLGVPLREVLAFGDSYNDNEFLRMAGLGVAVQNANEETKACADLVSEWRNVDHAVARTIELLEGERRIVFKA